ncbi:peptidase inhibitor family I36 protein [Streptomyces ferrugineus]|uniref:Peptidase inhibitor family I36 protein n=1 Tax=Streptomyces ferrugineus TaxID=1413221 RepID=A0A7M2SPV1_9ACTN|nr:peptidase inhibitor family I36 protein [Streptomyces ferrugineus]QOV37508.1 peptidase inhibitor family I36 protein [Streptomyces ferrugineus]
MRKRSLLLAGAALAATLPLASVQPASAATVCPQGKVCTWVKRNFEGNRKDRTTPGHGCFPVQSAGVRTVSNQSGKTVTVYDDPGCWGSKVVLKTGHFSSALPFVGEAISW